MALDTWNSKVQLILHTGLFDGMSPAELNPIASLLRTTHKPRGQFIYLPGDEAKAVYLVRQGRVKISLILESGREVGIDVIERGEMFGELALVDDSPRRSMAQVLEDVVVCVFEKSDFEFLLTTYPQLALRLVRAMGMRQRKIERKLADLLHKDVPARISGLLAEFGSARCVDPSNGEPLISLTHQDVANFVGASRQTTTAALNELERLGIIKLGRRAIRVKSLDRLWHHSERSQ